MISARGTVALAIGGKTSVFADLSEKIGRTDEFYDPVLYDLNVESGPRVESIYRQHLSGRRGAAVEFGCGTGTLLLQLARQGWSVLGIDRSSAMLDRFRERVAAVSGAFPRPELRLGDMLTTPPCRTFDVAICANDLCSHLLDRDSLLAGLSNAADHLKPGGRLLIDQSRFDIAALARAAGRGGELLRDRGCYALGEGRLQIWEQSRYDPDTGRLTARFRYEAIERDDVVRTYYRTLHMHPWRIDELVLALRAAGFGTVLVRDVSTQAGHRRFLVEGADRHA